MGAPKTAPQPRCPLCGDPCEWTTPEATHGECVSATCPVRTFVAPPPPLIARELVERFFGLDGYEEREPGVWWRGLVGFRIKERDGLPRMVSTTETEVRTGLSEAQIGARMALCAAAEKALGVARYLRGNEHGERAETAERLGRGLLLMAGIDPEQWVAAGKEGA